MINKKVADNRAKLMSLMSISEDVTRINSRLYEQLQSIMHYPELKDNIGESIENLIFRVEQLKTVNINGPLVDKEPVLLPTENDMSLNTNVDYRPRKTAQMKVERDKITEEIKELQAETEEDTEKVVVKKRPPRVRRTRGRERPQNKRST